MMIAVYLLFLFLNFIFAFRNKQSKVVMVLSFIVIILFMGGSGPEHVPFEDHSMDYEIYELKYQRSNSIDITDDLRIGYTLLQKFGNLLNLDFFIFRLIVIAICLILIYKLVIKRYSCNTNFIVLMYMSYLMIIDSEQLRNFIAMTIFLIGIRFLEKQSLKNNLKFLLMVLLASSFHTVFLAYVFLVFAHAKDRNRLVKLIVTFSLLLTIIIIFNNNQIPFLGFVVNIVENDKIISYLTTRTDLGYLIPVVLHLSSIMLIYWSKKILNRNKLINEKNSNENLELLNCGLCEEAKLANLVFWINIIGIIYFPLFFMSIHFYRIVRNFLILNFIIYSFASKRLRKGTVGRLVFNISIIGSVMLWFVTDFIIKMPFERLAFQFFTRNLFFN